MKKFKRVFRVVLGDDPPKEDPKDVPPAPPPPAAKVFDQQAVDRIITDRLASEGKRHQKEKADLLEQVKNLTQDVAKRAELEARLEEIRIQGLTKEEQLKESSAKQAKDFEGRLKESNERAERAFKTYSQEKILRELQDAASTHDAYSPAQVVEMLETKSRLVEELGDDQKPNGRYVTKTKFDKVDKDGKRVTLDLTPTEVVKAMKEDVPRFGNLFKAHVSGGMGASPKPNGRATDLANMDQGDFTKKFNTDRKSVMPRK